MTETEDGVFEVVCVSSHFTSFAVLMDVTGALNVSALHESILHEAELITLSHSVSSRNTYQLYRDASMAQTSSYNTILNIGCNEHRNGINSITFPRKHHRKNSSP